jgi:diadenosine tetraphosphate (Ap4A) HIT family hydrolase
LIEHAYPTRLKGWLVIVCKRHVEALHELTREELVELGELQALAVRLLHEELDCVKEYVACFAEAEHFRHIHSRVVAKPHDLPDEFKGRKIFAMINVSEAEALPRKDIKAFCETLKNRCETSMPCHSERASPSALPPP